jgi:hypothetical protein
MIRFSCPSCNVNASAPDDCAGRATTCRQCGKQIVVPVLGRIVSCGPTTLAARATKTKPSAPRPRSLSLLPFLAALLIMFGSWIFITLCLPHAEPPAKPRKETLTTVDADNGTEAPTETAANKADNLPSSPSVKLTTLAEKEAVRWKKVRRKVKDQFTAAAIRMAPAQTFFEGGILLPEEDEAAKEYNKKLKSKEAESLKKRQQEAEGLWKKHRFQYLVFLEPKKTWASVTFVLRAPGNELDVIGTVAGFSSNLPREIDKHFQTDSYLMDALELSQKRAAKLAAMPDVRCVVVIDLFSNVNPQVLAWYHDDGEKVKQSRDPPFPKLVDSLRQFVYRLQTTAN